MSTALVLRALGLGDLLTAVPALRALHRGGLNVVLAAPGDLSASGNGFAVTYGANGAR